MAKDFAEAAKKLHEKSRNKDTLDQSEVKVVNIAEQELKEKTFEKVVISEIDSLIDKHKKGGVIKREEIKQTFEKIIDNMISNGLMTEEEKTSYTTNPTITEAIKKPTISQSLTAIGKAFITQSSNTVRSDNRTNFDRDIDKAFGFNQVKTTIEAPNLTSLKDKILDGFGKICTSFGFDSLATFCRNAMSADNKEKLNTAELNMAKIADSVLEQAKETNAQIKSNKSSTIEGDKSRPIQQAFQKKQDQGLTR